MSTQSPVVQQRWLRSELRRARERAGATQKDVADALDWSTSKVIRIETGAVGLSTTDLRAMLAFYGITDKAAIDAMVDAAKGLRREAWWDRYRNDMPAQFLTEISYEASSLRLRQYQAQVLPGLLQTEQYARNLMKVFDDNDAHIELGVRIRMERQQRLFHDDGPEMFYILDEAVIRRWVGGPQVLRGQLNHLREVASRPNVHIQVLPFSAGGHRGMFGSFTLFEFPLEEQDFAVRVEHSGPDVLIQDNAEQISFYLETFFDLEEIALPKGDLDTVIDKVLSELPD
jgi:transcriptional regulator with XRE-family HTH domain